MKNVSGLYPVLCRPFWQLPILFFLLAGACSSTPPGPGPEHLLPPGYYVFDCPIVYERGMARLEKLPRGAKVQLLEKNKGGFEFRLGADQQISIVASEMDFPGLKRSLKGEGRLSKPGHAEGNAESWILNFGIVGRDHRTGPWTLRPATPAEIQSHENKERRLEERKKRAGMPLE